MYAKPAERVLLFVAALLTAAGPAIAQAGAPIGQSAGGAAGTAPAGPRLSMAGQPGISDGNPATAATISNIAARARAAKEASPPQGAPTGPLPGQVPGMPPYPGMGTGGMPLPGGAVREPGEPRLMSIAGRPGQERVEITFNGTIYNVSMRYPMLGTTGWRLTAVNVRDASVRIDNTEQKKGLKGKAAAGREASGYVISFSRRDPDFESPQSAGPNSPNAPHVAGMPGAYR